MKLIKSLIISIIFTILIVKNCNSTNHNLNDDQFIYTFEPFFDDICTMYGGSLSFTVTNNNSNADATVNLFPIKSQVIANIEMPNDDQFVLNFVDNGCENGPNPMGNETFTIGQCQKSEQLNAYYKVVKGFPRLDIESALKIQYFSVGGCNFVDYTQTGYIVNGTMTFDVDEPGTTITYYCAYGLPYSLTCSNFGTGTFCKTLNIQHYCLNDYIAMSCIGQH